MTTRAGFDTLTLVLRNVRFVSAHRLTILTFIAFALQAAADGPKKLDVTSIPDGASVKLDGKDVGVTPLSLEVPAKGKHQLTVSAKGFETLVRRVDTELDGASILVTLVDSEVLRLERALKKAQAAYDKANARLESAQEASQAAPDSIAKQAAVEKAEEAMHTAAENLEEAEKALAKAKDLRRTNTERALEAAKTKKALERPIEKPTGPAVAAGKVAVGSTKTNTVFCAWEIPVSQEKGKTWFSIRNGCFAPPVAAATTACNAGAKAESKDAKACDCTENPAVAKSCL